MISHQFAGQDPAILHHPQPPLHKKGLRPVPQTPMPSPGQGLNRSSCRSYIKVSSTHQRVGLISHPLRSCCAQSMRQPIKNTRPTPQGQRLRGSYQNSENRRSLRFSVKSSNIGEDLGGVDASLLPFLRAEEMKVMV